MYVCDQLYQLENAKGKLRYGDYNGTYSLSGKSENLILYVVFYYINP